MSSNFLINLEEFKGRIVLVALRKNLSIQRSKNPLITEVRYDFYITIDEQLSAKKVAHKAW